MKTLADRLYELCLEIENLPASEQQTKVSLLASDILKSVGGLTQRAADESHVTFLNGVECDECHRRFYHDNSCSRR